METMKVIIGEYRGHIIEVTGIFWFSRTVTGKLEDGTEMAFNFNELENFDELEKNR